MKLAHKILTGAALATVNRIPVLLLPGDVFASRAQDPVLQQLERTFRAERGAKRQSASVRARGG